MAKTNSVGLTQLPNGNWSCRIYMKDPFSGKKIDTTRRRDENGNPFKTRKAASDFRAKRIMEINNPPEQPRTGDEKTFKDAWEVYLNEVAKTKKASTVTRYKSLWKNHIQPKFEDQKISELTTIQVESFLQDLYDSGLSYAYVEGFTKFFWMILYIAADKKWITYEKYQMLTENSVTKIRMPKKCEDDDDQDNSIEVFEGYEIARLDEYFKNTNLYTAFLIGYYLGTRISECFGLMWDDIDWAQRTIRIDKQMVYEDGCFCLTSTKTKAGRRTIDIPNALYAHLSTKLYATRKTEMKMKQAYRNYERVLDKRKKGDPVEIIGGDFINRKPNGELLTNNSFKYHAGIIKERLNIDFKYHSLRQTHITQLALMNTPVKETMVRVGHTKYETTTKFYVGLNSDTRRVLLKNINSLTLEEPIIDVPMSDGTIKQMKQSAYKVYQEITRKIPREAV